MAFNRKQKEQDRADLEGEIAQHAETMRGIMANQLGKTEEGTATYTDEQNEQLKVLEAALTVSQDKLSATVEDLRINKLIDDAQRQTAKVEGVGDDGDGQGKIITNIRDVQPKYWGTFGEQLQSIARMATNEAMPEEMSFLRLLNAAAIGAGESIGADGGFLVQQKFASEIFTIMHAGSEILGRVRSTPVEGNSLVINGINETSRATGSRWGGVQGYWVGEGTAPTASQMKFSRIELTLKKLAAVGYATDELMNDASALTGIFTQAFAEELRWLAENAVINGSGAGEPMGILNGGSVVSVAKETGQGATTIYTENLSKMFARLHIASRPGAVWLINPDIEPELDNLFLAAGTGALEPRVITYSEEGALRIKGKPVIPVEYCPTLGTVGDIILADLTQYMMIDKNGVQQDSSMHVRFLQDETAFRAIYRVDGRPLWKSALTPANGSNSTSPFVTLDTRS